jgi:glycosyltransferase involved in cell wall biosynthesis
VEIEDSCRLQMSQTGKSADRQLPRRDRGPVHVIVANDFAHVNGGAAQVAISSAVGLADRGHRVTFFAAVTPVAEELRHPGINLVLTDQFDIKSDPSRLRAAAQGIWNPRSALKMEHVLTRSDGDRTILHVHGWTKALTSSIIRVALRHGVAVVVTLHDYFYACPNGGFFNFRRKESCPLRPLSVACLRENCDRDGYPEKLWRSVRQGVQTRFGFPRSELLNFITISDFSESVLKTFLPPDAEIYRIASPSDFTKEAPVDVKRNDRFVCLGRLSPEKGLNLVATAARDLNCAVVFVGEGPSRYEIQSSNPEAAITGWQPREQVKAYLRSARCLVLSSLWYEAQPMVVAEAAAVGVPAIVSDQCAGREMIENGVTGLCFRSGDSADLREKMRILQNPETAARMGRAAYDRHWTHPFTLEKHLLALERCYGSILGIGLDAQENTVPALGRMN